jgi:hypothetical protein
MVRFLTSSAAGGRRENEALRCPREARLLESPAKSQWGEESRRHVRALPGTFSRSQTRDHRAPLP